MIRKDCRDRLYAVQSLQIYTFKILISTFLSEIKLWDLKLKVHCHSIFGVQDSENRYVQFLRHKSDNQYDNFKRS